MQDDPALRSAPSKPVMPLPEIMVAPNGARKTRDDHPRLPMTLDELIADAIACHEAGAGGIHFHLRDADGGHLLDASLYREAVTELGRAVPGMTVQITTEAVGRYSAEQQRAFTLAVGADHASISVKEISRDTDLGVVRDFYAECAARNLSIQHILYDPAEFRLLEGALQPADLSSASLKLLFVLGRYAGEAGGTIDDLYPFLDERSSIAPRSDWAICAFGPSETACLQRAREEGGKVRVGFENSLLNSRGELAASNADRVLEIAGSSNTRPGRVVPRST